MFRLLKSAEVSSLGGPVSVRPGDALSARRRREPLASGGAKITGIKARVILYLPQLRPFWGIGNDACNADAQVAEKKKKKKLLSY